MSIPGDQPNPYAQQPPQQPHGQPNPYAQVPGQQQPNPYAQPTLPSVPLTPAPGGYGPGAPDAPGAPAAPQPPVPPGGGQGAGRKGLVWGLGGAVVASAVWAGAIFATGGFDDDKPTADLAGYSYTGNLCEATDFSPFTDGKYKEDEPSSEEQNPEHNGTEHEALDVMNCDMDFKRDDSTDSYSSAWLYTNVQLHKKSNPQPEFQATYQAYENQRSGSTAHKVKEITGIGDEAYLVTQVDKEGSTDGDYMILAVRDGWLTYSLTWSEYVSSSSGSSSSGATAEEIEGMLKRTATATLSKLKEQGGQE
ncbi:hypothetical protein [Streptomyces palmae]|uniref:DUF3558 domain-containing protein n=1 Tax=Streptomyces palmae TaxID=1701085 RepID=A0A4Z0GE26_9ACTN|nr:hypothetical protein [Streptomyces palmae]TGA94393.1 hypothetical protein E4099_26325 [Streptomyces palmae]